MRWKECLITRHFSSQPRNQIVSWKGIPHGGDLPVGLPHAIAAILEEDNHVRQECKHFIASESRRKAEELFNRQRQLTLRYKRKKRKARPQSGENSGKHPAAEYAKVANARIWPNAAEDIFKMLVGGP